MNEQIKSEMLGYPEKFYGRIRQAGTSLAVTIPKGILDANDWAEGDTLIVWVKKATIEKEE
jgi:antitoxin component of MazEF toxin-antitoxin module